MQMFTAQFTQKNCNFWQGSSTCIRTRLVVRNLSRIPPIFRNMSGESGPSEKVCSGNGTAPQRVLRPYQVVVAATRDMGIGKDGKLPWALPSDLRYFKEVTMTTAVAGKRNAVIMGRRTWESIPQRFRPLRGRLNVVLSRSGKMGFAAMEDVVICSDLCAALELVKEPPLSLSVEKVFVIGGGQVLKEALNAPGCEAIHLTDIKTSVECDTFIPRIDSSSFFTLFSSREMVENNIRFSFLTYVRAGNHDLETNEVNAGLMSRRHADFDYLKQIQERIGNSDTVVE